MPTKKKVAATKPLKHVWMRGVIEDYDGDVHVTAKLPVELVEQLIATELYSDEEAMSIKEFDSEMDGNITSVLLLGIRGIKKEKTNFFKEINEGKYVASGEDDVYAGFAKNKSVAVAGFKAEEAQLSRTTHLKYNC